MGQESSGSPLNVLVLYDPASVYINTVREHLQSFGLYSRHHVFYAEATAGNPLTFDLNAFDAIILHYSVRLAFPWHLSPEFAWGLKKFTGPKGAFLQDEYDHTWRACQWLDQLDFRLVFTCVPLEHVRKIYSKVDHARVHFVPTLTGYLPIESDLSRHTRPLADRKVVIGYRGRELPFKYGRLARETVHRHPNADRMRSPRHQARHRMDRGPAYLRAKLGGLHCVVPGDPWDRKRIECF